MSQWASSSARLVATSVSHLRGGGAQHENLQKVITTIVSRGAGTAAIAPPLRVSFFVTTHQQREFRTFRGSVYSCETPCHRRDPSGCPCQTWSACTLTLQWRVRQFSPCLAAQVGPAKTQLQAHGTFCMVNQTRLKVMFVKDRRAQQLLWMTNVLTELGRLVGLRNL